MRYVYRGEGQKLSKRAVVGVTAAMELNGLD